MPNRAAAFFIYLLFFFFLVFLIEKERKRCGGNIINDLKCDRDEFSRGVARGRGEIL
ncbi:hypothetical protein MANES_02G162050v8 [Manihot esculenta]|uniref:Uncharacterized protein n=1 Tax=Manihot esculenta TaxID=3983 RepID=A0ACB7I9A1_MANES|nr:hypothetical protein MANES_02G162050v8 [Manihot esculenta]